MTRKSKDSLLLAEPAEAEVEQLEVKGLQFDPDAVVLIFVENEWMAYVFAVWHGMAFGVQLPLNQVSFPDYFGRWSIGAIRSPAATIRM